MKKCPSCNKATNPFWDTQWLPFCSERCRLGDLGAWLNEEHKIPLDHSDIPMERDKKSIAH